MSNLRFFAGRKHERDDTDDSEVGETVLIRKGTAQPVEGHNPFVDGPAGPDPFKKPPLPEPPVADSDPPSPSPRPQRPMPSDLNEATEIHGDRQQAGGVPVALLLGIEGPLAGQVFKLFPGENAVGRGALFPSGSDTKHISRKHAALNSIDGDFLLEHAAPNNVTLLNGQPLTEHAFVTHGDRIGFGKTRISTFVLLVVPAPP